MERIHQLIAEEELDAEQISLYHRYADQPDFLQILDTYFYYELPHLLDYFRLQEVRQGDLKPLFLQQIEAWLHDQEEAKALRAAFQKENDASHPYRALSTPDDLKKIDTLCRELARRPRDADAILLAFFRFLAQARQQIEQHTLPDGRSLEVVMKELPNDWYQAPWYYLYVSYFGTDQEGQGGFDQLRKMLNYLEALGVKNLYILPHYETPDGDAGYDISAYEPAERYGGQTAFQRFMDEAISRGFRVATDLVFNHCSVEHNWFQRALEGDPQYFNYFLKCPAQWDLLSIPDILRDEAGDLYLYLPEKDETGKPVVSKRILIFPDVDQTLWLKQKVAILEKEVLFYREFYPFQVDMDIQEPGVVEELFRFLADELSTGILGKRTDAIAHWVKQPGTDAKNLPQTYALQKLIKQFLKHINPRSIILPEVVTTSKLLKGYAGEPTIINGSTTTSGGDALLDFQLQGMLREMLYFQKTTPFWTQVYQLGTAETNTSVSLVPIEHHDETYMGFIKELEAMRYYLSDTYTYLDENQEYQEVRRGIIYKNGMSAGARYADALNRDARRIANAFFCLYLMPGTPVIYYGTEIGAPNQWKQMEQRQAEQYQTLLRLLGPDRVGPRRTIRYEDCRDPRELQRGPIEADTFYQALKNNYPAIELISQLNFLRKRHAALRSHQLAPIDTFDERLLGMLRLQEGPEGKDNYPMLALSNLSEQDLSAQIPFDQLQNRLSCSRIKMVEKLRLEGSTPQSAAVRMGKHRFDPGQPEYLEIALPAYSALLFELIPTR